MPPLSEWPPDLLYEYQERASIREHDGGQTRAEAESAAMREVWDRSRKGQQEEMWAK
jgi:hypothetical protein